MNLIFQLREALADDLDAAVEKLDKAKEPVTLVDAWLDGPFNYYTVKSGDHYYQVVRFGHFVKCECKDFQFSGTACKHVIPCFPRMCRSCGEREVARIGLMCDRCQQDSAVYLKQSNTKPVETIGNIRI